MEEDLRKEIKEKLRDIYKQTAQKSNFKPKIFFDTSFEMIEDVIRETIAKKAEDEILFDLRDAVMYNTLFRIFIKEAINEAESEENASVTKSKIEDELDNSDS